MKMYHIKCLSNMGLQYIPIKKWRMSDNWSLKPLRSSRSLKLGALNVHFPSDVILHITTLMSSETIKATIILGFSPIALMMDRRCMKLKTRSKLHKKLISTMICSYWCLRRTDLWWTLEPCGWLASFIRFDSWSSLDLFLSIATLIEEHLKV